VTVTQSEGDGAVVIDVDFDAFYLRAYRRCAALAYALTGSPTDSADLVQEAFAVCYRRWGEVASYDDPSAWVRRVIVNKAMSRRRTIAREISAMARLRSRPAAETVLDDTDRELWRLVGELPKQQAAAIALHYVDDLSIEAIAVVLGCSTGAVKTHLARGRRALGVRLQQRGGLSDV
jgi:RNA polymerase sigma-70 factor (ECF subfamily)